MVQPVRSPVDAAVLRDARAASERERHQRDTDGVAQALNVLTLVGGVKRSWVATFLRATELIDHGRRELAPFKFLHSSQFIIFRFPYLGDGQPREYHRHHFFLFCANFNGGLHEYVERFLDSIPGTITNIWGGDPTWRPIYPNDVRLKGIILNHTFHNRHYYSAYPHASRTDIEAALKLRRLLEEYRGAARRREAGLRELYDDLVREATPLLVALEAGPNVEPAANASTLLDRLDRLGRRLRLGARYRALTEVPLRLLAQPRHLRLLWTVLQFILGIALRGWIDVGGSDRNGQARALAMMSPIRGREGVKQLDALLSGSLWQTERPFSRMPGLHFARWAIIEPEFFDAAVRGEELLPPEQRVHVQRSPEEPHGLASSYLFFAVVYDKPRGWRLPFLHPSTDRFVRELCSRVPEVRQLWAHCYAFPSDADAARRPREIARWVARCRVRGPRFYCDYPDATVSDIHDALDRQRKFVAFVESSSDADRGEDSLRFYFENGFELPAVALAGRGGGAAASRVPTA